LYFLLRNTRYFLFKLLCFSTRKTGAEYVEGGVTFPHAESNGLAIPAGPPRRHGSVVQRLPSENSSPNFFEALPVCTDLPILSARRSEKTGIVLTVYSLLEQTGQHAALRLVLPKARSIVFSGSRLTRLMGADSPRADHRQIFFYATMEHVKQKSNAAASAESVDRFRPILP
jgi:hypothetical protein